MLLPTRLVSVLMFKRPLASASYQILMRSTSSTVLVLDPPVTHGLQRSSLMPFQNAVLPWVPSVQRARSTLVSPCWGTTDKVEVSTARKRASSPVGTTENSVEAMEGKGCIKPSMRKMEDGSSI